MDTPYPQARRCRETNGFEHPDVIGNPGAVELPRPPLLGSPCATQRDKCSVPRAPRTHGSSNVIPLRRPSTCIHQRFLEPGIVARLERVASKRNLVLARAILARPCNIESMENQLLRLTLTLTYQFHALN